MAEKDDQEVSAPAGEIRFRCDSGRSRFQLMVRVVA